MPKALLFSFCLLVFLPLQAQKKPRIISLAPHLAEIVFALDAGEQLVATSEHTDFPEAAKSIRTIGNSHSLSLETIIGLQPDIVLAWRTGNPELQLQRLTDLGVTIFYSNPESVADLLEEISDIADLIGAGQAGQQVIKQLAQDVERLRQQYAARKPVNVFYQIWHQPLRTVGNDPWLNELLATCGGQNIFRNLEQSFPLVGYEAVLHKNPDAILIPYKETSSKETQSQETSHWRQWHQIEAVKKGHISQLNPDWLHRFTPRITQGLEQLCNTLDTVREANEH